MLSAVLMASGSLFHSVGAPATKLRSLERLFGSDEEIDRRLPLVRSLHLIREEIYGGWHNHTIKGKVWDVSSLVIFIDCDDHNTQHLIWLLLHPIVLVFTCKCAAYIGEKYEGSLVVG